MNWRTTMNEYAEKELAIGYLEGGIASVSTSIRKYITQAKKLYEKYPDQVKFIENQDGSIYMQFPPEWIKFPKPKKIITEENREKAKKRMAKARQTKERKNNDTIN